MYMKITLNSTPQKRPLYAPKSNQITIFRGNEYLAIKSHIFTFALHILFYNKNIINNGRIKR